MRLRRVMLRAAAMAAPLLLGAATVASAQDRQLFTWTGRVDREIQLAMRGRSVWTRSSDQDDEGRSRTRVSAGLPRSSGYVRVERRDGRGEVDVIQQPNSWNDYTTIIRIRDRSGGSDRYRIEAFWNDRDGRWDRSREDDDWDRDNNGGWERGDSRAGSRLPRVEPRDRSNDGYGYGNRTALRWTGSVDDEVEIRIQGRRVDYRTLSGAGVRDVRSDVMGEGLPRRDVQLVVARRSGRGTVYVVQQPNASNGYVAILRVRDPQGGYGYYDFDLSWR